MKTVILGAGSDLGVHIDGASLGPVQLVKDLKSFYKDEIIEFKQDENVIKSRNLSDRRKNEYEIEKFNEELYKTILEKTKEDVFPITIGGDKSVAVASALASAKRNGNDNTGIIWISSHADYNTFDSTITGNIAGLSMSAINGYKNHELRYFHDGNVIQTAKSVIVGTRNTDDRESENMRYASINAYTTEDIKSKGIETVIKEAFEIASRKTSGIHVCFCLDIFDPDVAPGVSIPEFEGLTEEEGMTLNQEILKHIEDIMAYDLIDFNSLRDENRKTEQIALNLLAQVINAANKKGKHFDKIY
ncbi:MAG: arginase family protein [Bacilli bacterium]|nr:arginase family protein [Bacilli bacterium]MBR3049434.1 arginase family protein [Bacilli bacterium]